LYLNILELRDSTGEKAPLSY